jgi:hypothetical protein
MDVVAFVAGCGVLLFCLQIIVNPGVPNDPINQYRERD